MDEVQNFLNELDKGHNPASVNDDGYAKLPDGDYVVRLDKIYIGRAKDKDGKRGRMQTVMEFEVINGPQASRKINKYCGMDTSAGLDFLTRDLRRMGIDNFKWTDVEQQFNKPLDKLFSITLKMKGEFQSIFINRNVNPDEFMASKSITGNDDDIPF